MSKRLSTSVTFQSLEGRVEEIEAANYCPSLIPNNNYLSSKTSTGSVTRIVGITGADNVYLGSIDAPANSVVVTNNGHASLELFDGAIVVSGSMNTSGALEAPSLLARNSSALGGSVQLIASATGGYTGVAQFLRSDGTRNGFVGFNPENGPMHYGSDTGAGHYFEGGIISPDPAMHFGLRFNSVDGVLDFDSGDYLYYSRSTDTFLFNIGGTAKATIDSSGVMSVAKLALDGQFYQTVASSTHNPLINFDSTDYLAYDRAGNVYTFNIAGSSACNVTVTGLTANGLSAPTISVDANFYSSILSSKPTISFDSGGDTLSYDRSTNAYAFKVAGGTAATIDATGIATPNKMFPGADPNFYAGIVSSQPRILWDTTDSLQYDRTSNALTAYIGGSAQFTINPSSTFVANVLNVGDGNFGLNLNGGGQPLLAFESGAYFSYNRGTDAFAWVIGNASKASIDSNGVVAASQFQADTNCYFYVSGGAMPQFVVDTGDAIRFDRAANKFYFIVGDVAVASIDASGNLRIKGALSQGVTP